MSQETITYLTNIVIVTILALLITHYWLRQGRSDVMRCWMVSAWVMTLADILFAARPELPVWVGRILPTLLVTVGHAGLYLGARKTAALPMNRPIIGLVVLFHAAGLIYFLLVPGHAEWRKVVNGVVWAGLSLASYACLRRAPEVFWKPMLAPGVVFLLHGLFHCARLGFGALFAVRGSSDAASWLQIIGDLEVSFFMVALFVGILVANLALRNEELTQALSEVQTLSGLLPICAWCKKVRDDDGYWKRVEDYFATHSQIRFTHGICTDCFKKLNTRGQKSPTSPGD